MTLRIRNGLNLLPVCVKALLFFLIIILLLVLFLEWVRKRRKASEAAATKQTSVKSWKPALSQRLIFLA